MLRRFNTVILIDHLDANFSRFNLHECTSDKCHYFVIRRNSNGVVTLQYKLKRYSNALYPRKYQTGDDFFFLKMLQVGKVVNSSPHRDDFTKEKLWNYTVQVELFPIPDFRLMMV